MCHWPTEGLLIAHFVSAQTQGAELTTNFKAWVAAEPGILRFMASSPTLAQAEPRAQQLTVLGMIGLEAVSHLSSGLPAAAGWKAQQLALLDEAEKPQALVRFTVIKPLRDLVSAFPEAPDK
jgi:hypothetical protein